MRRRVLLGSSLLLALAAGSAGAALQLSGPEFQVNTYTSDYQEDPSVCSAGDGSFVVVWEDGDSVEGPDGNEEGVFGQRFDAAGNRLGGSFQVNTYTPNDQDDPDVCCSADGSFVVVWEADGPQDGDSNGVFGQRFAATGATVGGEFQINVYTTGSQDDPRVCCGDGTFVVVWESYNDGSSDAVFGRRYANSGAPLSGEFQVNTYTVGYQHDAAICCAPDGDFVVAWDSETEDGSNYGVFGQRFAAAGTPQGPQFQVNEFTLSAQEDPAVCCGDDGGFAVAWESDEQDGGDDGIFARRYADTGAPIGGEFQVNTYTYSSQEDPAICCHGGGFLVAWESFEQDISGDGVYAHEFDAAGAAVGVEFQVHVYTPQDQADVAVACSPGGDVLVVWEGGSATSHQDGDNSGIFARLLAPPITILEIPTLAPVGLLALAGLLGFGAIVALRRR